MKRHNLNIHIDLYDKLKQACDKHKVSIASFVKLAVNDMLDKIEEDSSTQLAVVKALDSGRPPLPPEEKKKVAQRSLPVEREIHDKLKALADNMGMPISDLTMAILEEAMKEGRR